MEPVFLHLKKIQSPLYERRLMILLLKKNSYGRRSFSESSRITKIKGVAIGREYGGKEENKKDAEAPGYADSLTLSP